MAVWKCEKCGYTKESRCKPGKCPKCGATGVFTKKHNTGDTGKCV